MDGGAGRRTSRGQRQRASGESRGGGRGGRDREEDVVGGPGTGKDRRGGLLGWLRMGVRARREATTIAAGGPSGG